MILNPILMNFSRFLNNQSLTDWITSKKLIIYIIKFSKNKILREIISQNQVKWAIVAFHLELFKNSILLSPKLLRFLFYLLHRKEVIHPHVLVGIPCYDFTPVTCPTLTGPLPYGLGYRLQILQTPMAWRAVGTTPGNVFTPTFWFGITSNSSFMKSSCRLQSELRLAF